jgi:RHS repeat-associated protein
MPFGEVLGTGGGAISNDGNPLAFAGQLLDSATGLYDMRARNYDPGVGRFMSLDPLGYRDAPQGSLYSYARNNPLRFVGPSGKGAIGNTCGSLWCFLKSPEGRNQITSETAGCGLGAWAYIDNGGWMISLIAPEASFALAGAGCSGGAWVVSEGGEVPSTP